MSGIFPLSAKSSFIASLGPTLLRQKSRTRPEELTWTTYSSLGITTSLQYEHRMGHAVYGAFGLAHHTYRSDVGAIPGDTPDPSRRQHDLMMSVGLGFGVGN